MKNSDMLKVLVTVLVGSVASLIPCKIAQNRVWEITTFSGWHVVMDGRAHEPYAINLKNLGQPFGSIMKEDFMPWFNYHIMDIFCPVHNTARKTKMEKNEEIKEKINMGAEKNYHSGKTEQGFKENFCRYVFCIS